MTLTAFPNGVSSFGLPLVGSGPVLTTGTVYFVDSVGGSNGHDGLSPSRPFATIDYAVGRCTANNGDVIIAMPGHTETVTAAAGLDLDVAGITVLFLGEGSNRATITFTTAVGADMDVDAADITLGLPGGVFGPRFTAGIDALTGPIDVNSARFKMYGAKWYDGTTINTTDCVVADANADNMVIDDFEFIDGNAAGTQKQSFIQVAGATGVILRNIKCTGDFGTGVIENGTAWVDALLENLVLDNASASPTVCLLLQATSSGWVRNSSLRVASGTTGYTANNDMQFDDASVIGTDAQGAGSTVIGSAADAAATGAVTATDTAMAYLKQIVTMLGPTELDADTLGEILVGTAGVTTFPAGAAAANSVSLAEVLRYAQENIINGSGTALPTNDSLYGVLAGASGITTFPAAALPANGVSIAEVLRETYDQADKSISTSAAVLANGTATIFTVAGGPIEVLGLMSVCVSANDGTATTLKYTADPTDGAATDVSAASASLANATAGTIVLCTGTFASAASVNANGTVAAGTTKFIVPVGVIQAITATGPTTGTWTHHLRYRPLSRGVTVS